MFQSVKYSRDGGFIVILDDGSMRSIPNDPKDKHFKKVLKWEADGGTIAPADPEPQAPTVESIYDQVVQGNKVFKALVLSLNDGSFVVGGNRTDAQIRAIITAKM